MTRSVSESGVSTTTALSAFATADGNDVSADGTVGSASEQLARPRTQHGYHTITTIRPVIEEE
jgi:hypothetical protein